MGEGSTTKIDHIKKGTLIPTSLLEDLVWFRETKQKETRETRSCSYVNARMKIIALIDWCGRPPLSGPEHLWAPPKKHITTSKVNLHQNDVRRSPPIEMVRSFWMPEGEETASRCFVLFAFVAHSGSIHYKRHPPEVVGAFDEPSIPFHGPSVSN